MNEQWREIEGWPGYEVSSYGRVRSSHYSDARLLKRTLTHRGYHRVALYRDGKSHGFSVHALVLQAFIGPRPAGLQARHLNGIKTDNRPENLAWGTARENADDTHRMGRFVRGSRVPNAKLTEADIVAIRAARAPGCYPILSKKYGISYGHLGCILNRRTWRHVP